MPIPITTTAAKAKKLKAMHIPGTPLLLANIYDATSARTVASLSGCKALATASYALAQSINKKDETLTLDDNLSLARPIAAVAAELDLPLTVDIQDGYAGAGDMRRLREVVELVITELGAAGVNLEDSWHDSTAGEMMPNAEALLRIKTVLQTAAELGVPDFVVNARSDSYMMGLSLDESIRRGKEYLQAGATTVFVFWPSGAEMKREDVQRVIDEFGGMVNISPRLGTGLTTKDLARMGVARVSVGPQLYLAASETKEKGLAHDAMLGVLREKANEVFGA
jgi:2-methylisocitrate lyase-like PEP mutase family enzyme